MPDKSTDVLPYLMAGCMDTDTRLEAIAKIEAQAAEIERLRAALGIFADEDAWGPVAPDGQRKFWSPWIKLHPAAFARRVLEGGE